MWRRRAERRRNSGMADLSRAEAGLSRAVESISSFCLLAVLGLISLLVVLRYVFNAGIVGANEVATVLFVYATALGAAVEVGRREHIAITYFVERFRPSRRRVAVVFSFALIAALNLTIAWQSVEWIAVTGDYLMPATQMPRRVAQAAVPLGCLLTTVYCLFGALEARREGEA